MGLSHANIPNATIMNHGAIGTRLIDESMAVKAPWSMEGVAAEGEGSGQPANVFALKKAITEIESRRRS